MSLTSHSHPKSRLVRNLELSRQIGLGLHYFQYPFKSRGIAANLFARICLSQHMDGAIYISRYPIQLAYKTWEHISPSTMSLL